MTDVAIVGVGMTPFGRYPDRSLGDLGAAAVAAALGDAGIDREQIDAAFIANAMGGLVTGQSSIVGQVVLNRCGIDGIPVFNVDNACAGSASALKLEIMAIRSGEADMVLVAGVEKLYHSDRQVTYRALNGAADLEWATGTGVDLDRESVFVREVYPARLKAYSDRYGLEGRTLARIAVKNRRHAAANPVAQYRTPITIDEVLSSREIVAPLTSLMCAPIGDGATAVILRRMSDSEQDPAGRAVRIRASMVAMGSPGGAGYDTIRRLGDAAYAAADVRPDEIDVAEIHDATAFTELLGYEALRLCEDGGGGQAVVEGATALGGRIPTNTSGGLESRGHPVAASGLAQVIEIVEQLRGEAHGRQVTGARIGLAEIAGGFVGGDSACVAVHILQG